ncbi:MAG: thioredoxin domain-containing protein [Deltaproteobacteria bacterium]|nr:thioredoxin domain-containing protein [Deltaproteobacteria bacterium]
MKGHWRGWLVIAVVTGVVAVSGAPRPAGAGDIAWDRILGADTDKLDKDKKEKAASIMKKEKVYYGCKNTIAACLSSDPDSNTARRLAGMVVRKVQAGYNAEQIHEMIEKRGKSMHPLKTKKIILTGAASIGDENPSVKVVAFSDFQCPYCRKVMPRLEKLATKIKGVKLYFKHFPVKSHKRSVAAAMASLAALKQGKFWQFHDLCYKDSKHLSDSDLVEKAEKVGVADTGAFKKDLKSKSILKTVEKDKLEGLKLGVKGTPTIFINGKKYDGETMYADLKDVLKEELDLTAGKK